MIRYSLECSSGHSFESWFASSSAFDRLKAAGGVSCPQCGTDAVDKAIMAPAVATSEQRAAARSRPDADVSTAVAIANPQALELAEKKRELADMIRRVRAEVEANAEYVGPRFAEEARRIHFDEAEPKGIYGEATLDEVRELHEDGVPVLPLPRLPEDQN